MGTPHGNRKKIKVRDYKQWLWHSVWACLLYSTQLQVKMDH